MRAVKKVEVRELHEYTLLDWYRGHKVYRKPVIVVQVLIALAIGFALGVVITNREPAHTVYLGGGIQR